MRKNNIYLFLFILLTIFSVDYIINNSIDDSDIDKDIVVENEIVSEDIITDLAIKNIIVYPNRSDQKSIYIDIEIQNINGNEIVQVSLSNANNLIGSDQISLKSNQKVYFQSFLLKDNIDFKSNLT